MRRVLGYHSLKLLSMTVHISEYTTIHFYWKCHLFLRTFCAAKNLYVFHDVSLNGSFSSEQNVWLFRLLNFEKCWFKIHFHLQYHDYLLCETRKGTLCSLDKTNDFYYNENDKVERNHYQSSKTVVIVSQILRKNRPNNFPLLKNLVNPGSLTNSLAGRQRLERRNCCHQCCLE